MIKYSKSETRNLATKTAVENCLSDINMLIEKEGCSEPPIFANGEEMIDMDCVEKGAARAQERNLNKSMDAAFIANLQTTETNEVVLTEFRFNYRNLRNLKKQDLFGKVAGSTNVINGQEKILHKYYFIFESNIKHQAIRRFRNMIPSLPNNFIATDIHNLKALFF